MVLFGKGPYCLLVTSSIVPVQVIHGLIGRTLQVGFIKELLDAQEQLLQRN